MAGTLKEVRPTEEAADERRRPRKALEPPGGTRHVTMTWLCASRDSSARAGVWLVRHEPRLRLHGVVGC